ncbi:hypothetical protein [Anaeromyxobacter paludicola]|uniref:Lipoprotein n=1 Tax=Anaeromyxobacter paludicola TaxID=2918171 RepID=A0ABN6N4X7_9BACT|nr:hypothetical protein [Anaeromyxobacter paludicola]BDG06898.1 hypothetical protein AMPC_00110 [Anaeromyxobacter paludicola]
MKRIATLLLLAALGCASTAPHTLEAATLATGVALGFSAASRAAGGCYAQCTGATACNPATGLCEETPCARCASWEMCVESPEAGWRCARRPDASISGQRAAAERKPGEVAPGVGLSPATGSVPPPPSEASPRGP